MKLYLKIDISKLREDINLYCYDKLNYGLDKLIVLNNTLNKIGGYLNVTIQIN